MTNRIFVGAESGVRENRYLAGAKCANETVWDVEEFLWTRWKEVMKTFHAYWHLKKSRFCLLYIVTLFTEKNENKGLNGTQDYG